MKGQIHLLISVALLAGFTAPLPAQANATADLMTYGDVPGGMVTVEMTGANPNANVYLLPSLRSSGTNYLVSLSGDANDFLTVDIDLASAGTYLTSRTNAQGKASVTFPLANNPTYFGLTVYWQGFTQNAGGGASMFQDFTNLRAMTMNHSGSWASVLTSNPDAHAVAASVVLESGSTGGPIRILEFGGGPAIATSTAIAYHSLDTVREYDCRTETHIARNATMQHGRAMHTATMMNDGRVLLCGGAKYGGSNASGFYTTITKTVDIYDPATDTMMTGPDMSQRRAGHTAHLLADGRVMIIGGTTGGGNGMLQSVLDILGTALKSTEIFDPTSNTWSSGPNLPEFKAGHQSTQLSNGDILVAGGVTHILIFGIPVPDFSNSATVYNMSTGTFGSSKSMRAKRAMFGMQLLPNGDVACFGGAGGDIFNVGPIATCEYYDASAGNFVTLPNLSQALAYPRTAMLDNGHVLVIGGASGNLDDPIPEAGCEDFNPASGTFSAAPSLSVARGTPTVYKMEDGTIYVGGGESNSGSSTDTAESFSQ